MVTNPADHWENRIYLYERCLNTLKAEAIDWLSIFEESIVIIWDNEKKLIVYEWINSIKKVYSK